MELASTKWKGGHLKMRTADGKWERVWVLIHRNSFYYFEKKPSQRVDFEKNALGQLDLKNCKVNRDVNSTSNSRFEIVEYGSLFTPSIQSTNTPKNEALLLYHNDDLNTPIFTSISSPATPFSPFNATPSIRSMSTSAVLKPVEGEDPRKAIFTPSFSSSPKDNSPTNVTGSISKGKNTIISKKSAKIPESLTSRKGEEDGETSPLTSPLHSPPLPSVERPYTAKLPSFESKPMRRRLLFSAKNPEEKVEWITLFEFATREPVNWGVIQSNFEKIHKQVKDIRALNRSTSEERVGEDPEVSLLLEKTIYQMMSSLLHDFTNIQPNSEVEFIASFTGNNEIKLVKAQAIIRGWLVRRMMEKNYPSIFLNNSYAERARQKRAILREIIDSEVEYLRNLMWIQQRYMIPFEKTASDETESDQTSLKLVLFDNLREISKISKDILTELRLPRKGRIPLGKIFLDHIPRMSKIYKEYSVSYIDDLQQIVRKKKKNSAFKKFLKNLESDRKNVLSSLLLLPILRLMKYEWLLKEYYGLCLKEEKDNSRELVEAIKSFSKLNDVNEMNRETAERFEKIFSISLTFKNMTTELLEGPHEWVREGPVIKVLVTGPERCYLYLLSDAIVVTLLLPDGTREFESMIKLDQYLISDMEDSGYIKNCFKLTRREQKGESHVFGSATNQEKRSWIFDIGEVMSRKKGNKAKSPVLQKENNNNNASTTTTTSSRAKVRKESSFLWLLEAPIRKCIVDIPSELPKMRLSVAGKKVFIEIDGPTSSDNVDPLVSECDQSLEEKQVESSLFCKSVSTYPIVTKEPLARDGDPVADHFAVKRFSNRTYVALTDGCNWGPRPQRAAQRASAEFIKFLQEHSEEYVTLEDVGQNLLLAASAAHNSIIKGHEDDIWAAGTTTLLGGIMLQFEQIGENDPQWGFAFLSVGDCKAFLWRKSDGAIADMTALNRGNLTDGTDPGGRLGPYVGHGAPDLRNLKLYFYECQPGDIVFICSDGIHDNFDPQQLGKGPRQVDSSLNGDDWKEFEGNTKAEEVKNNFRINEIKKTIGEKEQVTPQQIVRSLLNQCIVLTAKCRDYMEQNPGTNQPKDYNLFPGKFDHTTCVAFRVGEISDQPLKENQSNPSTPVTSLERTNELNQK
eukprot:TRINITY_DN1099_c0_g1_i2.p1 TRINITY_DN1099_c0_g1~~TRINITY_DN1099_c0_g1_i2.p1  ORF type:complete len:1136 (+),score=394.67 TRINITY_DN1099_c0_g1_i2:295-3702(+)